MQERISNRLLKSLKTPGKAYEIFDSDLPGLILRVQPSGVSSYYVRFRLHDGSRKRIRLGSTAVLTPAQARERAREALADAAKGSDPSTAKKKAKALTLASYLEEVYEPWVQSNHKSWRRTMNRLKNGFKPIAGKKLHDLNPWTIEKWRAQRRKDGKVSDATLNRDIAHLKSALSKAVLWGILKENPIARVKLTREDSIGRIRYLTPQERERLFTALAEREERICKERDSANAWRRARGYKELPDLRLLAFADYLKPMTALALNTGMRRGELFDLTWADVDFSQSTITVRGAKAKSGKTRHIPLNETALTALEAWQKQIKSEGLVFPNPSTGGRFDNIAKAWGGVMLAAKIDGFRFHDLRHTFASELVMAGIDLNTVRELLGHSDLKMTLRYSHLSPQVKAAAVATLDSLSNIVSLDTRRAASSKGQS